MAPEMLALTILGSISLGILSVVLLYSLTLLRRTNIVMKKVDYLVEDLTYKSESLSISVDAMSKISNYVLAADAFSKKGFSSLLKLFTQNKNFFYELIDKIKEDPSKKTATKKVVSKKKPAAKKTTAKKAA
jgi:uncharacterized protein YoxC